MSVERVYIDELSLANETLIPLDRQVLKFSKGLTSLQQLPERDFKAEEKFVKEFYDDAIKSYGKAISPYKIGVKIVESFGIHEVDFVPRGWRKGLLKRGVRKRAQEKGWTDKLRNFEGTTLIAPLNFHGFMRGDKLGYAEELGDNWYIVAGWEEKTYIASVESLSNIQLIPLNQ